MLVYPRVSNNGLISIHRSFWYAHMRDVTFFPTTLCGFSCFWFCIPGASRLPPPPASVVTHKTQLPSTHHLCHTIFVTHHLSTYPLCHPFLSHTHHLGTHHVSHTIFQHTIFVKPPLSHTIFQQTLFVTHHLCHTPSLSHTIFQHTLFVTHHLSTNPLCTHVYTPSLSHTIFQHTLFVTHLCHTIFVTHHLSTGTLRTHHFVTHHLSTYPLPSLHVAGTALGDICLRFTWQAWHSATSTFVLRGRRGTCGTGWRACVGFGRGWRRWRRGTLRGRRGTWRHPPFCFTWKARHLATSNVCVAGVALMALGGALGSVLIAGDAGDAAALCVAGVALGDIHLRFTWQARHLATSTFVLRGRRGTYSTSVARRFWSRVTPVTPRHFAWQAWHLATSTFVSRRHLPSFCVAGVALVALDGALGSVLVRGDAGDAAALCVAGVALGDIHLCFTWQAYEIQSSHSPCGQKCMSSSSKCMFENVCENQAWDRYPQDVYVSWYVYMLYTMLKLYTIYLLNYFV